MTVYEEAATVDDIIVCRDVHKWFGEFHVLRGITTSVRRGEKVVILGPSGSGKSTFIRAINRLEEHQRGDIVVDGVELTNDVRNIEAIRREVGMVFQSFNLFPHLTVMNNIMLAPIKVRKWAQGRSRRGGQCPAEEGRHSGAGGQVPLSALGGTAAAGRHRPGPCHAAQDNALRRAHVGAGPGDDKGGTWTSCESWPPPA